MAFWQNPLLRKTFVFMLAGLLGLAAIVAASLWLTSKIDQNSDEVIQERKIRIDAAIILGLATDAETGQRGFVVTDDPTYLEPYQAALPRIPEALGRLSALAQRTPRIRDATDRVSALMTEKLDELARTIVLIRSDRRSEALDLVRSDRGKIAMDGIRDALGAMIKGSDARVAALLDEGQLATRALFWVTSTASVWILVLAVAAGWTVTRHTRELATARAAVVSANLRLEDRVKERTAALARANDEIQRFAYIVSHDLRAPLVNIVGFTSELETSLQALQRFVAHASVKDEEAALAADARIAANDDLPEALGFIRASTTKMDRLINAILKLSREGRRELHPEPVDLHTLFGGIAASVQHQLDQAGATIVVGDRMPAVVSDRLALEQVFGNLIDNAVKYLSPDRPGRITITAESKGPVVTIEVADNGRGIAPADHERVFELFRRSGPQNVPGEGIGLAHVRALVRRLGGDISIESDVARGSRFQVTIPHVYVHTKEPEQA